MENYSKLLIDSDKMINGKKFTYDIKSGEFVFETALKNFDMEVFKNFKPRLNEHDEFKARLENEIYKLSISSGEYRFEASMYSMNKGLRYYSVNLKNSLDLVMSDIRHKLTIQTHLQIHHSSTPNKSSK